MTTRYVMRRIGGSWQVLDSRHNDFVMGEYGAGAQGAAAAQALADQLNDEPAPEPLRPAPPINSLRTPANLLAWRRARKLSQQALGDLLEVHKLTVHRWESGQVPVPRTTELALLYLEQSLPAVKVAV